MDVLREGRFVNKPPLLEGVNYPYWKARMKAFIKAIDEKTWRSILTGWTHPTTKDDKGTDTVKASKLQMLTTRFERLRMEEDECIADFNSKLCDIANEAFALGEKYTDAKLVKKTLRSLPARFAYKVTAIEEAKNVEKMRLDELIGNLQTFEMNFKAKKKSRGIALNADYDEMSTKDETDEDEDLSESLTFLTKKFNEMLRKFNKKGRFGENSKNKNSQKKNFNSQRFEDKKRKEGIQCRECEGFGHVQAKCANTLKKKNKAATASWSDDSDENQEDADDHTSNYVAFTVTNEFSDKNLFFTDNVVTESVATVSATTSGRIVDDTDFGDETEDDSDDDDLSLGKIQEAYKKMYSKWLVVCKRNKSLEDEVGVLTKERDELKKAATNYEILATKHQGKLAETRLELEQTQKNLRMLNSGTSKLDHLLSQQKNLW
ncbi:uncharacterized protein LOC112090762 [Morus notabilis]|uniref:uncharacterized protein LOC112090762 n=1 Tax=Morus notabilis TaxID=981085 RepID=UPI000CED33BE|nr:uncharacterized protein LOC112090762 [Morus notabilis]